MTEPPTDAGYVFEVLDKERVSFRRADMANPQAREAMQTFLSLWFQVGVSDKDIDFMVARIPDEWPYFTVKLRMRDGKVTLQVFHGEREPGKNSGENAIITNIECVTRH
jgi:hypothetical protein